VEVADINVMTCAWGIHITFVLCIRSMTRKLLVERLLHE
jgi:hypothetical protein